MKESFAKLLKVKSIITFFVIFVFTVLSIKGDISSDNVMIIVSSVISFYFGTQAKKDN